MYRCRLRRFARDNHGGIAVIFACCLLVLGLSAGIAIDYGRSMSIRTSLQNDLDAAIIAAAARSAEDDDLKSATQAFFDANWHAKHGVGANISVDVAKSDTNVISGMARASVPTLFMGLAGINEVAVSVASQIELAGENAEIALVLDTTASMSGWKLDALKNATGELIDAAYSRPGSENNVKISLVPFDQHVNVGLANRNAPWMSVPADTSSTNEYCYTHVPVIGSSNCRMETFTATNDGTPYTYQAEVCDYDYGPPESRCDMVTDNLTWHGCAASRDYPLDVRDEDFATPVPGAQNVMCGSEVTPLTNDPDLLKSNVNNFVATGETYIPSGLFWGWTTLSKHAPFDEASDYGQRIDGKPVKKILVLMTDGFNTKSPRYASETPQPRNDGTDTTLANQRTAELCQNIKDKGIEIHTVAFDVADVAVKSLLEECASGPSEFYDATDAAELASAFSTIGANLSPLRIAR